MPRSICSRNRWPVGYVLAAVLLLPLTASHAEQDQPRKDSNQLARIAGSLLQVAATNYTGPHQQLAQSIVTLFNGGDLRQHQTPYDTNDPYGVYASDVYAYDAGNDSQNAEPGLTNSPAASSYPAGTPSLDAALIGFDAAGELTVLDNGATLRGPSESYQGDRIGVAFMPSSSVYIYVVSFDGTGWIQSMFPDPMLGHQNPVPAGEEVFLPGDELYGLDSVPGVETIYLLASNAPRPDVEAQLLPFFGKERPPGAQPAYRSVEKPTIIARGLTGLRPASVNQTSAATATPSATPALNSFLAADGADELAITLWFNHE